MPRSQRCTAVRGRRLLGALAFGALLLVAPVSCGDETPAAGPTTTADPTDVPDTDAFDFSNVVEIRDGSVAPAQTVATTDREIVFRNTTSRPQELRATNGTFGDRPAESGPIEPGAEFAFRQETPISITYEVLSQPGVTGRIQVDPGIESI